MPARDYQQECIDLVDNLPPGRYLVQMATGLGKTYTFTHLKRTGRTLILSHREELVRQPLHWYDCETGVEMAASHASPTAEVVSASVMTMARRLERFRQDDFSLVVVDEAHHAASRTYRSILGYFQPEKVVGFTATPNRGDHVRLDDCRSICRRFGWCAEPAHVCGRTAGGGGMKLLLAALLILLGEDVRDPFVDGGVEDDNW